MSVGNLAALRQTSVKRMLAYSSVAQAGYILMGLTAVVSSTSGDLATLGMNGLNGLLLYLFAYLFTNVGAFMVVWPSRSIPAARISTLSATWCSVRRGWPGPCSSSCSA